MWIGLLTIFQLLGSIAAAQRKDKIFPLDHLHNHVNLYSAFMSALHDVKVCKSLSLCELAEKIGVPGQRSLKRYSGISQDTHRRKKGVSSRDNNSINPRSYYGNYGAPNAALTHTYVPAFLGFDPISVLASLAFLAFLVQSFASLFDRSRSIIPTIVSSRQTREVRVKDIAHRAIRAINKYELLNEQTTAKNR